MKSEDLQTRQMTTEELRDFVERTSQLSAPPRGRHSVASSDLGHCDNTPVLPRSKVDGSDAAALHDPARGVVKCAHDVSEPTTTRRVAEPSTGRMRMRPLAEARTDRPDAGPRTSALTAPLAIAPISSPPRSDVLPPLGRTAGRIAGVASVRPKARGMALRSEWVAMGALTMVAVGLSSALLRSADSRSAGAAAPAEVPAFIADAWDGPDVERAQHALQEPAAQPGPTRAPSQAVGQAQPLVREPESALTAESEGEPSRPNAQTPGGPRRAVDLLLAGETRVALEAYRALANQEPSHAAYALAVKLLEKECLSGGGGRCE